MPPSPRVPMLDLEPEIEELWDEVQAAIAGVMRSGRFILGPNVLTFEAEVATFVGCRHAVGVASGTDAVVLALRALGVGPGDEVITTAFTFVATAEAICTVGAFPVFADIEPDTCNLDPADVERRFTDRTRAILPVHLYGAPAALDDLLALAEARPGVVVVEDAAQAFGATVGDRRVGSIGHAAAFSFFPSKPLGCFGDGGMVVTDDDDVAATVRMLRAHGSVRKGSADAVGYNSRLDELQAAILRVKLPRVDAGAAGRRRAARRYTSVMSHVAGVVTPPDVEASAEHLYTVRVTGGRRDAVAAALGDAGIETAVHYATPLHRVPAYARPDLSLPETERAAGEVLSLPMWPTIGDATIDRVVEALAGALAD